MFHLPSAIRKFQLDTAVPRQTPIHYAHLIGTDLSFTSPIDLQPKDFVWVDILNGRLETVERSGAAIWRAGWMN